MNVKSSLFLSASSRSASIAARSAAKAARFRREKKLAVVVSLFFASADAWNI